MDFPQLELVRTLVRAYARVASQDTVRKGARRLVLPNGTFFPDPFVGDLDSVQRFADRMLGHVGMAEGLLQVEIVDDGAHGGGGCGGGCGGGGCGDGGCAEGTQCAGGDGGSREDGSRDGASAGGGRGEGSGRGCACGEECSEGGCGEGGCACGGKGGGCGEGSCGGGGCGEGACKCAAQKGSRGGGEHDHEGRPHDAAEGRPQKVARMQKEQAGWRVRILAGEVRHPVVLAAVLARSVGTAAVWDGRGAEPAGLPLGPASELAATAMGLGVLLAQGAHIYQKGCKGPTIGRVTELGCMDLSIVLALFAATHGQSLRAARRELGATQQECLAMAKEWVASNSVLVQRLEADPKRVADGDFRLQPTRSWLSRLFGSKPKGEALEAEPTIEEFEASLVASATAQASERSKAKQPDPKMDEIRRLVDEAMDETQSESLPD